MSPLVTLLGALLIGAPPTPAPDAPTFDVMAIKSGHELIVKKADTPTTFRLAGIVPIKGEPGTEAVGRLNQTNYLRQLVPVGSKVRIVRDGADVHVFRARDGQWVNRAVVAAGFATASATPPALPELQTAETDARQAKRGMWSPDFAKEAAQPTRYDRVVRSRPSRSTQRTYVAMPPGGGMPALGLGETPVPSNPYPYMGMPMQGMGMTPSGFMRYGMVSPYGPSFGAIPPSVLGMHLPPAAGTQRPVPPHLVPNNGPLRQQQP